MGPAHKWEENQGIGKSFGHNRAENDNDYKSAAQLVELLVDSVSRGGNFLLDIGPTADGRVPMIMQERLLRLGAWLKLNSEAIYGTHPWRQASEAGIHYTAKDDVVYASAKTWPEHDLQLTVPHAHGENHGDVAARSDTFAVARSRLRAFDCNTGHSAGMPEPGAGICLQTNGGRITMPGVRPTMEQVKVLVGCNDLCGECPLWDVSTQQLYWTDCVGLKIHKYGWVARRHECLSQGGEVNSFTFNAAGGFVVANNSGLWQWDGSGTPRLIADTVEGIKCQLNDSIADVSGRVLAGSWFYDPKRDYPLGHLIRVDLDGKCAILDEGIHLANGLGFSPDDRTLYFADSVRRLIYAYDYEKQNGTAKNRRVFVNVPATEGLPDGLAVDAEGFVWAAQWYGGCLVRYDPDGKLERRVDVPAKQTSNLAFGGPELTDIFITTAAKSEPMPVMPPGYDPDSGEFGGPLYHVNLGIQGRPEPRARIRMGAAKDGGN